MSLERSNQNIQNLLEATSEGIYGIDNHGCCTFANRATSEMTGWPVDELIGKQMHDLLHHHRADGSPYPHHDCPIYSAFRQVQGCRVSGEVFWRRDGSFFHVDYASNPTRENGVVTGAVVTFMDVSVRIQAEATLRETQEQQRLLAEAIPQQVWTAQPDGTLDYVNARVVEYFGRSRETIIGMGWLDMVHSDDVAGTVERWTSALSTGQPYEVEFRLLREDGDYRWNLGRALPLHDANGAILKWFGTNTDITERK
ncbi:MAG: PAS domain-containing protein, partial [Spartobacteria bacterium]